MATVKFDADSISARILASLQTKSEWADFLGYSNDLLINSAVSAELAYKAQYHEYLTTENFWSKARNKSSLLVESPAQGYIVPRKYGATGTLMVSTSSGFNTAYAYNIPIAKYFEFSNGDLHVCAASTTTLLSTSGNITFVGVQGKPKSVVFTANGNQWETYIINDSSVENLYFDLYVNDVLWTNVDTLFDYDGTSVIYELNTAPTMDSVTIKFGNGSFGKKLISGDIVKFYYISTDGANGNISGTNKVTVVESQAYDEQGNPVTLYVKNTTAFLSGKDYPTLEEIRSLAPRVYQTGDRGTSRDDDKTIIKQLSYITKINVWGVYEYNQDNSLDPWTFLSSEENVVHLAALNASYDNLTTNEKTELINDIYENCDPTDIFSFSTVVKIYLIFTVVATVKNTSYILADVKANILETITDNYSIENIDFGTNIYSSDFVSLIDGTTGVLHHTSSITSRFNTTFTSAYVSTCTLPLYPISGASLLVYISINNGSTWTLIATGDTNGTITGQTGYDTTGSTCTLATGITVLVVNSGLTSDYSNYSIKYVYACANADLVLNQRYYIFAYDTANITVKYPS
jgi:hypothetical protein